MAALLPMRRPSGGQSRRCPQITGFANYWAVGGTPAAAPAPSRETPSINIFAPGLGPGPRGAAH